MKKKQIKNKSSNTILHAVLILSVTVTVSRCFNITAYFPDYQKTKPRLTSDNQAFKLTTAMASLPFCSIIQLPSFMKQQI